MLSYLNKIEPVAVKRRLGNKFRRGAYIAAGVNDHWAMDQHDKFIRFGLFFHFCMDPFLGQAKWLRVWYTNHSPVLINSFYLDACRKIKGKHTNFSLFGQLI